MSNLSAKDFVFHREKDTVYSGGFKVESSLLRQGLPILENKQKGGAGGVGSATLLSELAVPAGLLYLQQNVPSKMGKISRSNMGKTTGIVPDSLFDKLLDLAAVSKPKKRTLKRNNQKNNRTRKNR